MPNSGALSESIVTSITIRKQVCSLDSFHLRHKRLEGISSGYWTPLEKRSQGHVSSGSSTLLPSAVLRPASVPLARSPSSLAISSIGESLTVSRNRSNLCLTVSQAACQLLAPSVLSKGSGVTTRGFSHLGPLPPSNFRSTSKIHLRRKLKVSAQDFV